jgi:ceramide glucosyltransferase
VIALPLGATVGAICCFIRVLIAYDLQRRLTQTWAHANYFWLVPIKDVLQAAIWLCAFVGNKIEWRGQRYTLKRDGTLVKNEF